MNSNRVTVTVVEKERVEDGTQAKGQLYVDQKVCFTHNVFFSEEKSYSYANSISPLLVSAFII